MKVKKLIHNQYVTESVFKIRQFNTKFYDLLQDAKLPMKCYSFGSLIDYSWAFLWP